MCTALDASCVIRGAGGERDGADGRVPPRPVRDRGRRTPRCSPRSGSRSRATARSAYAKVERRAGDWAVAAAGAAVIARRTAPSPTPRVGLAAVGRRHRRARRGRRRRWRGQRADRGRCSPRPAGVAAAGLRPGRPTSAARVDYKRHLADELTRRTLRTRPARAQPRRRRRLTDAGHHDRQRRARSPREVEPRLLLVHFLRDHLGLTGTHWGCDTSNCGTCVVWLDGEPVKSCTVLAAMADGHEVRTVEGLEVRTACSTRSSRGSCSATACSAASARPG